MVIGPLISLASSCLQSLLSSGGGSAAASKVAAIANRSSPFEQILNSQMSRLQSTAKAGVESRLALSASVRFPHPPSGG
jgi:hypothetical protein